MRLWRGLIAVVVAGLILTVGAVRFIALMSGTSFTAPGELQWSEWAWREGSAEPLREADKLLRAGEPVDIAVIGWYFDEGWWRTVAKYYLPSHEIDRIEAADRAPAPRERILIVIDRRKLRVIRAR